MVHDNKQLFSKLNLKFLFLIWGTPDQGARSRVLAKELGFEVCFLYTHLPRGPFFGPLKYFILSVRTLFVLFRKHPQVVFVQNPPLFAVLWVSAYCWLTGAKFVIDAHSAAFTRLWWTIPPDWFKSILAKRALTTIVTNEYLGDLIRSIGGHAVVIKDVPTTFNVGEPYPVNGKFNVVFVSAFSPDEPLRAVVEAVSDQDDIQLYVTGKLKLGHRYSDLINQPQQNILFTDFLPNKDYYSLLNTADAVICLTTRNHTMQRGACEALSLGKPIITSDWPLLRNYFNKGTVHVDNTAVGIKHGILQMKQNLLHYQAGIKELQQDQQREWHEQINLLATLIKESVT